MFRPFSAGILVLFSAQVAVSIPSVIIVPGLAGTSLEATWDYDESIELPQYCPRSAKQWTRVWPVFSMTLPGLNRCWRHMLSTFYDPVSKTFNNTHGAIVRAVDFGGLGGLEYLDGPPTNVYGYAHALIRRLEKEGLKRDVHLFGAPYDFRTILDEMHLQEYYRQLESLLGAAATKNPGQKTIFVCHSLGCPLVTLYIHTLPQAARQSLVIIALGGAWAGAVSSVKAILSGDNEGIAVIEDSFLQPLESNWGGLLWMMPQIMEGTLPEGQVIVQWQPSPHDDFTENFTASSGDLKKLFGLSNATSTAALLVDYIATVQQRSLIAPNVTTHLLFGIAKATPVSFLYVGPNMAIAEPRAYCEDPSVPSRSRPCNGNLWPNMSGDATVLHAQLTRPIQWAQEQLAAVTQASFKGISHLGTMSDGAVMDEVAKRVMSQEEPERLEKVMVV